MNNVFLVVGSIIKNPIICFKKEEDAKNWINENSDIYNLYKEYFIINIDCCFNIWESLTTVFVGYSENNSLIIIEKTYELLENAITKSLSDYDSVNCKYQIKSIDFKY